MPKKKTSLVNPTVSSGDVDRPYSQINSYFLTPEELAEVQRKNPPPKKVPAFIRDYSVHKVDYKR